MPSSQWLIGRQRDFRGGETQAELPEEVGQNQLIRMENAMISPTGFITSPPSFETTVVSNALPGLAVVPSENGLYNIYSTPVADTVYGQILNTASDAPVNMLLGSTESVEGANIEGLQEAVHFLGKDYCTNPNADDALNGVLNLSDFVLINVPGSGARSSKLRLHINRLWLIFEDGLMAISDNGDATTWNALNVVLLPNSEPVVDFHPVQGGAIVYSASAVYAMYGADYQDISFNLLLGGKHFTTGSVEVNGTVYVLSTEGIYAVNLNGAQLIPHKQERYFQELHGMLDDPGKTFITAVYLQSFRAIVFTWPSIYSIGGQALVFYLDGAYSKWNWLLSVFFVGALGLNDAHTDFIFYEGQNVLKSSYQTYNLDLQPVSILQTRHEDCGSNRDKVWSEFVITVDQPVYGLSVDMILDDSDDILYRVADGIALQKGENIVWLDELPRSKTISTLITIDNSTVMNIVSDDDPEMLLTDEDGNELVTGINPGAWTIKELRLRYRLAGPDL